MGDPWGGRIHHPLVRTSRARPLAGLTAIVAFFGTLIAGAPARGDLPPYAWEPVSSAAPPATMHPGQKTTVAVVVRNTGTATWQADGEGIANPVRLAPVVPRGRASAFAGADPTWLWSGGTRIRMTTPVVEPGDLGLFAFTFTAPALPSYPATFIERFAPIVEGVDTLDSQTIRFVVIVRFQSSSVPPIPNPALPNPSPAPSPPPLPPVPTPSVPLPTPAPREDYAWSTLITTAVPAAMHPGLKIVIAVVVRNDGEATWNADGPGVEHPVRLAAVAPQGRSSAFASDDPTWLWSGGTRIRMTTPVVEPGGIGLFLFSFTAPVRPSYPQTFVERFAPVVEDIATLDQSTIDFRTIVRPASSIAPPLPNPPLPSPPCDSNDPESCSPVPVPTLPTVPPTPTVSPVPTPTPVPTLPPLPTSPPLPCEPGPGCVPQPPPLPGGECSPHVPASYRDALPPAAGLYTGFGSPVVFEGLSGPRAATIDPLGKFVIADTGNDQIVRGDLNGQTLLRLGSTGSGNAQFRSPWGVAASATGRIYVADTGNNRIQVFSLGGTWLTTFGSAGAAPGAFALPRGLSMVTTGAFAGAVAVADTGNNRVQIVGGTGAPLIMIGAGVLSAPTAVSVYRDEVYVADTGNDRVVRFTLQDQITGTWGGTGTGSGCMSAPSGVIANEYGLFVADTGHDRIQRYARFGPLLETWGTGGSSANQMRSPAGLTFLGSDLWVVETAGNRVQRFRPPASAAPPLPCGGDPTVCFPTAAAAEAVCGTRRTLC